MGKCQRHNPQNLEFIYLKLKLSTYPEGASPKVTHASDDGSYYLLKGTLILNKGYKLSTSATERTNIAAGGVIYILCGAQRLYLLSAD